MNNKGPETPVNTTEELNQNPKPGKVETARRKMSGFISGFKETFAVHKKYKPEDITEQLVAEAIERATRLNPDHAFKYDSVYDELDQFAKPDPRVLEAIRIRTRRIVKSGALETLDFEDEKGGIVPFFGIKNKELLHKIATGEIPPDELQK